MKLFFIFLSFVIYLGKAAEDHNPQDEGIPDVHREMDTLAAPGMRKIGKVQKAKLAGLSLPTFPWPYVGEGCCNLSTTRTCLKQGGECIPRNDTCIGDVYLGTKYCNFNNLKSCQCCVPPNCETLSLCKLLNGTCNMTCEGRSLSGKDFCKDYKYCKCCLPEEPQDCPCGQDTTGGCKGQYLPDKWARGHCEKNCSKYAYPLEEHTCNKTGGEDCNCCASLEDLCSPFCINGHCIAPNECECNAGWMGPLCETRCCEFGGICYENGTQLPNVCTRLTCTNGEWVHGYGISKICSSCYIKDDPHFTSWYGKHFSWHGKCSYSLVQHGRSTTPTYGVYGKFGNCLKLGKPDNSCISKIIFENDASSIVTFEGSVVKFNNGVINPGVTPTSFGSGNEFAVWKGYCWDVKGDGSCYCILGSQGLMIQYCSGGSARIWAYEGMKESLYGLCGYLSKNSSDQFTARDGTVFQNFEDKFAESWEVSTCPSVRKKTQSDEENCDAGGSKRSLYIKTCSDNIKDLDLTKDERRITTENCAFDRCVILRSGSVDPSPEDWLKKSRQEAVRDIAIRKSTIKY